jgi:hypothetical protein
MRSRCDRFAMTAKRIGKSCGRGWDGSRYNGRVMLRSALAAAILAGAVAPAHAQSASAPLIVSATVVSTCRVDVPRSAEASIFATVTVAVTCARGSATPRVQRPIAPRYSEVRDALLIINF